MEFNVVLGNLKSHRSEIAQKLHGLDAAIGALTVLSNGGEPRRVMSKSARRKISAAQHKRWAAYRKNKK